MKPLNLSAMSWNDFVANAVFFVIDVALLSILVPFLVQKVGSRSGGSCGALD
jgi:hypothetical protein